MIEANELRIGNIISTPYGLYSIIDEVGLKEGNSYVKIKDKPMGYYLYACNPIPLTEDMILKCGFDKYEYNDYRHPVLIGTLTLYEGVAELHISDIYSVWVNNLHQLQNLFYCLCGFELDVNI